jgi:uncharacterized protein (TIGR02996 family)
MSLNAAVTASQAGDTERVLAALLEAWRERPHPRVADLIDVVSAEVTLARGPVTGKTVTARLAAAVVLHERRDPADLERLLAVPWAGTWQKALPLLQALLRWPADPRLDRAVGQLIATPPWISAASWSFFRHLTPVLPRLQDVRVVPQLEAMLSVQRGYHFEQLFRAPAAEAVARLKAQVLPPLELELLATLEARHRNQSTTGTQQGEPELLARIYAQPNDRHVRSVFADWLLERGDPRGEALSLHLLPKRTSAQGARLNALLKRHGAAWAGSLDAWFHRDNRQWEGCFLVGGELLGRPPVPPAVAAKDDAWRLVKTLGLVRFGAPPAALLDVAPVEVIHGADSEVFLALVDGPPRPSIKELSFGYYGAPHDFDERFDGAFAGVPALESLGLRTRRGLLSWVQRAPIFRRLRAVRLTRASGFEDVVAFLRDERPNISRVEVREDTETSWLSPTGWHLWLARSGPGPFTEVTGSWSGGSRWFTEFTRVLDVVDPGAVKTLTLSAHRAQVLTVDELEHSEAALRPFAHASVTVPWTRPTPRASPRAKPTGPKVELCLNGDSLLDAKLDEVWQSGVDLGLALDSYAVGYGGKHRALGKKPLETIGKWAKNPRCERLLLYQDGSEQRLTFARARRGEEANSQFTFSWAERKTGVFLDWLEGVLDRWQVSSGVAWTGNDLVPKLAINSRPAGGWLTIFGPEQLPFLPVKELEARLRSFPGAFVRKTQRNLVLGAAADPERPLQLEQLGLAVSELVRAQFEAATGVDFEGAVNAALDPVAKQLGLARTKSDANASLGLSWTKGAVELRAVLFNLLERPMFQLRLSVEGAKDGVLHLGHGAFDAKALADALKNAVTVLEVSGAAWLEKRRG